MGGPRCTFRKCHVTKAKFSRMHFFGFPLKDAERLKKWIEYSQIETSIRNKVICGRHFRVECFMNYKMEKLAPNAVPTLTRLSEDQALDYELNVEMGVLVTLEKTNLEHLIPPDSFECPLHLENDKILIDMLNQMQENIKELPMKSSVNTMKVLETTDLSSPSLKRTSECEKDEIELNILDRKHCTKKYKVLKSAHCSTIKENKNKTRFVPNTLSNEKDITNYIINDNLEFVDSSNLRRQNNKAIQKDDGETLHGLSTIDSNLFIAKFKTDSNSFTDSIKQCERQNKEIEQLQFKISLLENENSKFKKIYDENSELRRILLHLEMENNQMRKILKEQENLKEKIVKYSEENKQLREENECIALLKEELLSRLQKTEELKVFESFISTKSTDSGLRIKTEHHE